MRRSKKRIIRRVPNRSAFTLVEMLVSVALVLMLMTMFASIFQIATGSVTKQRGISELDQKARSISTVVRKDLQHRTFRYPLAFYPGENSATSPTSFSNRAGYIYISTNDPNTGLDDLIQFTVSANILSEDAIATPYFGRATGLWDLSANAVANPDYTSSSDPRRGSLYTHMNQPETDDGTFSMNSTGSSTFAEISYFIRRGSLYRRVSLIREPLSVAGKELGPQPTTAFGNNYFSDFGPVFPVSENETRNDFFLHFDYSAARIGGVPVFLGTGSLSNETESAAPNILANPVMRFGFNPATGRSREHTVVPAVGPPIFLGRFTQGETSALNFNSPQATCRIERNPPVADSPDDPDDGDSNTVLGNGNPFDIVNTPLALNPGNGVVSDFDAEHSSTGFEGRGGERRVEDLLLSNVHEMKVELWDQRLQRFVAPGHSSVNPASGEVGDYHFSRCNNPVNGPFPTTATATVFDTWHPTEATVGNGTAPYVAYRFYPPRSSDTPPGPSAVGMPGPVNSYWIAGSGGGYSAGNPAVLMDGSVIFAPVLFDGDIPEVFEWENTPPLVGLTTDDISMQAFQIGYVCVAVSDLNGMNGIETGATPPIFPTAPGRRVTDNEVTWESFDNRRPLQSIRLQFRFQDKTSDNMRQLSLVIPMTETTK